MESDKIKLFDRKIAEDIQHDDYDKLPIESFGKEMLLRMGWKENKPIGKSGPVEPIVFKPRNFRLGLGAEPLEEDKNRNTNKLLSNAGKTAKNASYGTKVKITTGKHKGLKGKIVDKDLEYEYLNKIIKEKRREIVCVELKLNKQIVKIEAEKIKLRKSSVKNKSKAKGRPLSRSRSRSKSISSFNPNKAEANKNNYGDKANISADNTTPIYNLNKPKLTWVHPNTLVRIITKNSPYYNTKAVVVDLVDLFTFSLLTLNDNVLHDNFTEESIETVIPKLNEEVTILVKELRGETAKLLERNKKNNKVVVQLMNDFSIVEYTQDDVAATSNAKF